MNVNVTRFDQGNVKGEAVLTDEGYIRAHAVVTRTGILKYLNSDGTIRSELRHPDDVWLADSIQTMELIPITNGHPSEKLVTAENAKRLAIGYTGETIKKDGDFILSNLVITDKSGVEAVTTHNKRGLSLGYTVDLEMQPGTYKGEKYDARQRNIRYNHLAIVDKARAGDEAKIVLDELDAEEILSEEDVMTKKTIKIDGKEIMLDESTADYIERLEDDLKNLTEEKARVEREIVMIEAKLEKALGENDSLKDKMGNMVDKEAGVKISLDSAEFKNALTNRIKLYKLAENHLKTDQNKLDSLSDLEIKKLIINQCRKSINLDGKSEIYIDAMFDTIIDDQKNNRVNISNVQYKADETTLSNPEESRRKMIERQKKAHLGGKNE
jgi:uncharacterized protein